MTQCSAAKYAQLPTTLDAVAYLEFQKGEQSLSPPLHYPPLPSFALLPSKSTSYCAYKTAEHLPM